jgi:prepilin-type processing-associated H-X9-DG protein/prepilin-type N-terminal cleavage/methylation domain-containing protein
MKRPGFSLVELLVVVATISILLAILLPALQYSKHLAKATVCSSNLHQIFLGLAIYDKDNESLPYAFDNFRTDTPPEGYVGACQYDAANWWWFYYMDGFFSKWHPKTTIIRCPAKNLRASPYDNDILCSNYGVNVSVFKSVDERRSRAEFAGSPLSMAAIPRPGQTLLVADSGYVVINWWHVADIPPVALGTRIEDCAYIPGLSLNKKKYIWSVQQDDAFNGRHPGKRINILFADGHISRMQAESVLVEKQVKGYKNRMPLWVPK